MTKKVVGGAFAVAIATISVPHAMLAQGNDAAITCGETYTVVGGDTLSRISNRAYGDGPFDMLFEANRATIGSNPNMIFVGQEFVVPCVGGDTANVVLATENESEEVAAIAPENLVFTFNKTSAPKFIINSGIVDIYLAEIAEVTDGRVQFVDPAEMNRDASAQFDLVTSGTVDAAYVFNGYLSDTHPLLQLPMVPLMGGSAEQTAVSLWRLHDQYLAQTDYFDEAKLLGFIAAPAAHIWRLSDQPVVLGTDIANTNNYAVPYFEGLDTRGPKAVRAENEMQLMAQNEAENGTLTFFMAHGAARAAGIWTEDRTVTEVDNGLYTPTFSVILSNDAWSQISPRDQAAITEISGEHFAHRSASWDAFDEGHRRHMLDTGLNIVRADAALLGELADVSVTQTAQWAAQADAIGVDGQAALAAYQSSLQLLQDRIFR